jgi:hypothetical protein
MCIPTFEPIPKPPLEQNVSLHDILFGPTMTPLEYIAAYDEDKFEAFINEWAFEFLKELSGEYEQVLSPGGAGDKGRDILCYKSVSLRECDVFQCKHYASPLAPGDARIELAKLCFHTFNATIPVPGRYRFVCPKDASPTLVGLLDKPEDLKANLIEFWLKTDGIGPLCTKLVANQKIHLEGSLLDYVQNFDFSIVHVKPILEVVAEFRRTNRYAARFGGGLTKPLPPDQEPPPVPTSSELVYVGQLIAAYRQNLNLPLLDLDSLKNHALHLEHYTRSRERFYCAETIREFAKDAVPSNFPFEDVQNSVYYTVVDTAQDPTWSCGLRRVNAVTDKAALLNLTNSPYATYLKPKSLQGVCHQLANLGRLKWVHDA